MTTPPNATSLEDAVEAAWNRRRSVLDPDAAENVTIAMDAWLAARRAAKAAGYRQVWVKVRGRDRRPRRKPLRNGIIYD